MLWSKLPTPPRWVMEAHRRYCFKGAVGIALLVYAMLLSVQLVLKAMSR